MAAPTDQRMSKSSATFFLAELLLCDHSFWASLWRVATLKSSPSLAWEGSVRRIAKHQNLRRALSLVTSEFMVGF